MKLNKLLFILFFIPTFLAAQSDFSALKNSLPVPKEFDKAVINTNNNSGSILKSKKEKKLFANFQQQSNYFLIGLFNNGQVLYSGPVYDYVQNVTEKLLQNNPIKDQIHVFISLSNVANAFTLNNGYIFINIGLIGRLETEAQLAFVLAHEIAHYKLKHVFIGYKKKQEIIKKGKQELEREYSVYDEKDLNLLLNHYSRNQEEEADLEGLNILKNSPFEQHASVEAINKLNYANLPFENIKFEKSFFESPCQKSPYTLLNDSLYPIEFSNEESDTENTHPSLSKRMKLLESNIAVSSQKGQKYVIGQNEFEKNRDLCRVEMTHIYLYQRKYVECIYSGYMLLKKYPNSEFISENVLKSIYFLQKAVNLKLLPQVTSNPNKLQGELRKLQGFFTRSSSEEANAICLNTAYKLNSHFSNNSLLHSYYLQVLLGFEKYVSPNWDYFKSYSISTDSLITLQYAGITEGSSQKKMYKGNKTERKKIVRDISFAPYFPCIAILDPKFKKEFDSISVFVTEENLVASNDDQNEISNKISDKRNKKSKIIKDISNELIILDVSHIRIDNRGNTELMYVASENKKNEILSIVAKCAEMNKVKLHWLTPESNENKGVDEYNERSLLENWIDERNVNFEMKPTLNIDANAINQIEDKYHSKYVCVFNSAGILNAKSYGSILGSALVSLLYPPLIMYAAFELISLNRSSYIEFTVYNIQSGKVVMHKSTGYSSGDDLGLLKAEIYSIFYSIGKNEK